MAARKDYYAVLGVPPEASREQIKRRFRNLARDSHPDANPGDPEAEARFRDIAEAYEVLSDPQRRAAYDRGERLGDLFSTFAGFDDLLDLFFGSAGMRGGFGQPTGPAGGRDVSAVLEIDLEEAAFGTSREMSFPLSVQCEDCSGSGAATGTSPITCTRCGGSGAIRVTRRGLLGSLMSVAPCDRCGGAGQIIEQPCAVCRGNGIVSGVRNVEVDVPAGVTDRARLRLTGQGESGRRNAPAGDLFVEVRVRPHETFQRDGDDLRYRLPVTMVQAALGAELEVPLIEGGTSTVTIPAGTQHGAGLRMSGKGMSRLNGRGRGDLVVEAVIEIPEDLSSEEEEALRRFAELRQEAVHSKRRTRFF